MKKQLIFGSLAIGLLVPVTAFAHNSEAKLQSNAGTAITSPATDNDKAQDMTRANKPKENEANEAAEATEVHIKTNDNDADDQATAPVITPVTPLVTPVVPPVVTTPTTPAVVPAVTDPVQLKATIVDPQNPQNKFKISFRGTLDQLKAFFASIAAALHL